MAPDKEETYQRLLALGDSPSPDDVDGIIGNETWTHEYCDGCKGYVSESVCVGQVPDYESSTATLCRACVFDAVKVLEQGAKS